MFLPYSHIVSRYMAFPRSTATFGCFWSCSHYFLNRGSPCSRALGTSLHSLFKTTSGGTHSLRLMSSHSNGAESSSSHLERTEHSPRQEFLVQGTVTEMTQLSKTVKGLSIEVKDRRFSFKCGQWVDFFIPGVPTVGGFTICSSHRLLKEKRSIDLAVKHSEHPPALWVHTQCQVGSKVHMKVGGECYFDPNPEGSSPDLLLIAGGVGINPLYSIAQHVADISSDASYQYDGKTVLLFSAKNQDELLYKDNLLKMSEKCPSILCKFFVTKPDADTQTNVNSVQCERGRINESRLQEAVSSLDRNRLICYICGPPPMIQQITEILYKMDIEESRILFEKWW